MQNYRIFLGMEKDVRKAYRFEFSVIGLLAVLDW